MSQRSKVVLPCYFRAIAKAKHTPNKCSNTFCRRETRIVLSPERNIEITQRTATTATTAISRLHVHCNLFSSSTRRAALAMIDGDSTRAKPPASRAVYSDMGTSAASKAAWTSARRRSLGGSASRAACASGDGSDTALPAPFSLEWSKARMENVCL